MCARATYDGEGATGGVTSPHIDPRLAEIVVDGVGYSSTSGSDEARSAEEDRRPTRSGYRVRGRRSNHGGSARYRPVCHKRALQPSPPPPSVMSAGAVLVTISGRWGQILVLSCII